MGKEYSYQYDNCKDCVARCQHAGKNRKFVYSSFSCKIVNDTLRIDRSAWEPCESCEDYSVKCCENCGNQGVPIHKEPCKSCYCANNWEPKKNFCPSCGRPLTDAAWETLDQKIGDTYDSIHDGHE